VWKVVLVLMVVTNADQRLILQDAVAGGQFATKAECDTFAGKWAETVAPAELRRIAEVRAPAHRAEIKSVRLIDSGCADPGWSGAFPVLGADEGFPAPKADTKSKPH
jgi:hypothetical protein